MAKFTGSRVVLSARERDDGQWSIWVVLEDTHERPGETEQVAAAWKCSPLKFDSPTWNTLAVINEAQRHLAHLADLEGAAQPDELDLWGNV